MSCAIRQAQPCDEAIVSAILGEAAAWLIARDMSMWQQGELEADRITADVAEGLYFLAECDGVPAGTLRFQLSDPLFWPDVPQDEAAYIHRLAVRREFAGGTRVATALAMGGRAGRSLGRRFLRLDCDAARPRLAPFTSDLVSVITAIGRSGRIWWRGMSFQFRLRWNKRDRSAFHTIKFAVGIEKRTCPAFRTPAIRVAFDTDSLTHVLVPSTLRCDAADSAAVEHR